MDKNKKKIEKPEMPEQKKDKDIDLVFEEVKNPIWLSISEGAKIGGVQNKTIRRGVQAQVIKYKIIGNRYLVELASLVNYLLAKKKLKNKLAESGLGQYVDKWRK